MAQSRGAVRPADLPNYENPPVNEVVIGIQFDAIAVTGALIGLFWAGLREEFPKTSEQPPLDRKIEELQPLRFSPQVVQFGPLWRGSRHWLTSADEVQLIQIQNDRLVYNWRRGSQDAVYPHFEALQDRFWKIAEKWNTFLKEEEKPLKLTQWEVSYINHIPTPHGRPALADILSFWGEKLDQAMGGTLDAGRLEAQRVLGESGSPWARMYVNITTAIRSDQVPVVIFELTVRGPPGADADIWDTTRNRLFEARRHIVTAFDLLTTSEMHAHWGRRG